MLDPPLADDAALRPYRLAEKIYTFVQNPYIILCL